jgi:hypothetical protein
MGFAISSLLSLIAGDTTAVEIGMLLNEMSSLLDKEMATLRVARLAICVLLPVVIPVAM